MVTTIHNIPSNVMLHVVRELGARDAVALSKAVRVPGISMAAAQKMETEIVDQLLRGFRRIDDNETRFREGYWRESGGVLSLLTPAIYQKSWLGCMITAQNPRNATKLPIILTSYTCPDATFVAYAERLRRMLQRRLPHRVVQLRHRV